ncbi:hypothetical protein SKAU_G00124040 [Synaphobranchus kaupii]|uniref:Uncharacterized protein n=1 Tax=Synaphobranchus kaupii TaxID=118154 RepID=A0A9Q1J2Q1_SYNKA|nr:hypothetical protein SKAU_G00124040 [Synaphobranchus kaupii]
MSSSNPRIPFLATCLCSQPVWRPGHVGALTRKRFTKLNGDRCEHKGAPVCCFSLKKGLGRSHLWPSANKFYRERMGVD